jgi:hypothetical protein
VTDVVTGVSDGALSPDTMSVAGGISPSLVATAASDSYVAAGSVINCVIFHFGGIFSLVFFSSS